MTLNIKDIRSNQDLTDPKGDNTFGSKDLFYWRDLYKSFIYPGDVRMPRPVDFWYQQFLYGRLDDGDIPVYPRESALKQLIGSEKTVLAVNFVADAFEDFRQFMLTSAKSGEVNFDGSKFESTAPARGFISSHGIHYAFMTALYSSMVSSFINPTLDRMITNPEGFMKVYKQYVDSIAGQVSFSRENWIISTNCPVNISGLVIDLNDEPIHSKDKKKFEYISDRNFYFFSQAAEKYGFRIDKNAPWRLVADIDSSAMQSYMEKYDYTREDLFDKAYYRTCQFELELFKKYCWAWYNEYITFNPMVDKVVNNRCSGGTKIELAEREVVTQQEFSDRFSEPYWLRLFAYVRAKEENKSWNQQEFDRVVMKTQEYMKYRGKNVAMEYLYRELRRGKKFDELFLRDDLTQAELDAIMLKNQIEGNRRGSFQL